MTLFQLCLIEKNNTWVTVGLALRGVLRDTAKIITSSISLATAVVIEKTTCYPRKIHLSFAGERGGGETVINRISD